MPRERHRIPCGSIDLAKFPPENDLNVLDECFRKQTVLFVIRSNVNQNSLRLREDSTHAGHLIRLLF